MNAPEHHLHLYQKPKIGNAFIRRLLAYNYSHTIDAMGGFDTASFDIALRSVDEMQQFLDQNLGNRVAIYADNPAEPIWEGFINRMTFSAGGVQYTISLDEMLNKVNVQYINTATSTTVPATTGAVNDTNSQAIYAIKEGRIDIPAIQGSATTGMAGARDTILAQRAWPKASITRGDGDGLLRIECLGFYHTLEWEVWVNSNAAAAISQNGAGTDNITTMLTTGATAIDTGNNTTFFDPTDQTEIVANSLTFLRTSARGETYWQRFVTLAEVGDGTNYWIVGLTPTLWHTGTRRMYYRPANTNIVYTARQADGLQIRNQYGQLLPPWTVRPDAGIRVTDMLIGWDGLGDNPTETYIRGISYDANEQTIDYWGDDNTRAEGAFQFNRESKQTGRRFGATPRMV